MCWVNRTLIVNRETLIRKDIQKFFLRFTDNVQRITIAAYFTSIAPRFGQEFINVRGPFSLTANSLVLIS